jgi:hypothetical protein
VHVAWIADVHGAVTLFRLSDRLNQKSESPEIVTRRMPVTAQTASPGKGKPDGRNRRVCDESVEKSCGAVNTGIGTYSDPLGHGRLLAAYVVDARYDPRQTTVSGASRPIRSV